ncbi:hypothetical protein NEDG_01233 [Nematocida displodere]|uniref:Uncharacterized protein n=1 Tax=Nematocida displodere TaxID=1805483 RepID=A0A177EAX2_9MICR|nr:hypothetical protein NEDG_01233 [Nematocida displodere]
MGTYDDEVKRLLVQMDEVKEKKPREERVRECHKVVLDVFIQIRDLDIGPDTFSQISRSTNACFRTMEDVGYFLASVIYKKVLEGDPILETKKEVRKTRLLYKIRNLFDYILDAGADNISPERTYVHGFRNNTLNYMLAKGRPVLDAYEKRMDVLQREHIKKQRTANHDKQLAEKVRETNLLCSAITPIAPKGPSVSFLKDEFFGAFFTTSEEYCRIDGTEVFLPNGTLNEECFPTAPSENWRSEYSLLMANYYAILNMEMGSELFDLANIQRNLANYITSLSYYKRFVLFNNY